MIVLSSAFALGLALVVALVAIANMRREANNLAHVADDDYERQGTNWTVFVLAVIIAVALLGATGIGPLAGVVMVEGMR